MWPDRPGCPGCRAKLVRRLKGEPWTEPGTGPGLPVRHYGGEIAAYIAIASAVIGTGIAAYGQYAAGQQAAATANYNAMIAVQQGAYQNQLAQFQAGMLERQALGQTALAEAEASFTQQQSAAQEAAGINAAEAAGRVREAAIRAAYNSTQSDVRAAIGKSGVDTTGSPLMVLLKNADTVGQEIALNDYQTALDVTNAKFQGVAGAGQAALTRAGASMRADALGQQAQYVRYGGQAAVAAAAAQGNLFNIQGSAASRAAMFNTGSTLLGGIGNVSNSFLRYGSAGTSGARYGYPG